jgi:hypothetical protein
MPPGMKSILPKAAGLGAAAILALAPQIDRGAKGISNIAQWLGGSTALPGWLLNPQIDNIVSGLGLVALSGPVFWWTFGPKAGGEPAKPQRVLAAPYPDWSIAALFIHVDPTLTGSDDIEARAAGAGSQIQEKLKSGELQAWGKLDGSATALKLIPVAFWQKADWTYWFLPDEKRNRELVHATLPRAEAQYRDVHVNYAEATQIWRK